MKISRTIVGYAVFSVALAAPLMQAQDSKPPEERKKTTSAPREHQNAPAQQHTERQNTERQSAPPQQHTAPPVQQQSAPTQRRDVAPPAQVQQTPATTQPSRRDVPRDNPRDNPQGQPRQTPNQAAPQTHRDQPVTTPLYRNPQPERNAQPAQGTQPGRTFGNQPAAQPGRTFGNNPGRAPEAARTYTTRTGDVIHRDSSGQVRQVRMNNGTVVYHPPNAPRRVEVVRPGGRIVVASAPGHGYVQRPIVIQNTTIIKRTYVYNGIPQARIYRPRVYNGINLVVYQPVRYYRPTFYAYAYNPWAQPVYYGWGWRSSPWYGYYGGYFTPYPVYASPSLWLTDYLLAATLEAAYQERMDARAASAGNMYVDNAGGQSAPLTPEVKQAIADEVRRQIDRERAEGQNAGASGQDTNIFADNGPHVFVVHSTLAVASNAGDCSIGEGDVLQMNGPPQPNSPYGNLTVLASRGQDCRKGSVVSVNLQDLQEMQNQMQATIDRGMGDLQSKQGQGGLPALPQGSAGTIDSPFAQAAQPDANVAGELTSVSQEADRAEQQAVGQADDAGGAPPTLTLGLSIDDVKSIQGEPQKIVDLGAKKIYVYKDLKITFTDGKVTDIQ